jgi:hypothetical protein
MSVARFSARIGLLVFAVFVAGCGDNVNTTPVAPAATPTPTAMPTASPTASPTPIPFSIAPTSLTFGAGSNANQAIVIAGGTAPYTASGCSGVVTSSVSGTTVTVTAIAAGSCTLTISNAVGNSLPVAVTVTTVSVPIQ